jgi:cardiolipin synthase A/B
MSIQSIIFSAFIHIFQSLFTFIETSFQGDAIRKRFEGACDLKTAIVIIAILLALLLWVSCDLALGRRKQLSKAQRKSYPIRQSNIDLITAGPELFEKLFLDIKNAKKHIHILFYIVKNDKISGEFLSLLKKKAEEGVEVRLLLDWVGSMRVKRKLIAGLKEAGVRFAFCHVPRFPYLFYSSQSRNHRKITVIDGSIGYLGGYNIGKEYVNLDAKLCPWRDYHLRLTGEGVEDLQSEFLYDWQNASGTDLHRDAAYFPDLPKGSIRHQHIPTEAGYLEETFLAIIRNARVKIIIGTPYFIPSPALFQELQRALKRGVRLSIIVPAKTDHLLVKEASYPYLRVLLKEGARIYQYTNGFYHAKILLADDTVCDIGTANFDKRSLYLNHELNCYIYEKSFIRSAEKVLEQDMKDSKLLMLKTISGFNAIRWLREGVAKSVSYFL